MLKGFRTKLALNNKLATVMARHAGYARWVWNWGLALWREAYKEGLKPNANKLKKLFTNHVKPQYGWMSEVSSRVYQYTFINLAEAYTRYFKKLGDKPVFKKKGNHDSFTIDNCGKPIRLGGLKHKLPFIGWVKTYEPLPECVVKKVSISREADSWYISFAFEHEPVAARVAGTRRIGVKLPERVAGGRIPPAISHPESSLGSIPQAFSHAQPTVDAVGVDLGINALATLSTGVVFPSLKPYRQAKRQLARLQRQLSRKVKGSKNRNKALVRLARKHSQVANIRRDYLHKITTYIAKNHSIVVIEDLNVSGMMANHKLAAAIADMGFYEFRRQLEYKCQWYGTRLVVVDRFYPSTKLCSGCGHEKDMPLKVRQYDCPSCNLSLDRDLNAAINLANRGRLALGSLLRDSRSHAPVEAESKPHSDALCRDVLVL